MFFVMKLKPKDKIINITKTAGNAVSAYMGLLF